MLYALEVPPAGGDTHFASMYAAHDALPEALRRRVRGLKVKHDGTYNSGGYLRAGNCKAILFLRRPFMGKESVSVQFFNEEGGSMFKVFVAPEENRALSPDQLERFEKLRARLAGKAEAA